jgi:hypothetical protein
MLTYSELLNEVKGRPIAEQLTLLEELARLLRTELSNSVNTTNMSHTPNVSPVNGWPVGYFEQTFGSLSDVDLERQPQGVYEIREPFE